MTLGEKSGPDSVMETAASRGEKGLPLVLRAMGEPWEPWEAPPPYRVRAAAATSAPRQSDPNEVVSERRRERDVGSRGTCGDKK